MTAKKWIVALLIAVLAGAAIFLVLPKEDDNDTTNNSTTGQSSDTDNSTGDISKSEVDRYTAAEVASHDSREDCWTIIEGSVYNITSYISGHEGGDEILRACGIDATSLFTRRETAEGEEVGSGTPHSSSAERDLARLKVGELSE